MTRGVALLAQVNPSSQSNIPECLSPFELTGHLSFSVKVSNYDNNTGLPLVHLWNMVGDEVQCLDTPGLQITFIVQQSLLHVANNCSLRVVYVGSFTDLTKEDNCT